MTKHPCALCGKKQAAEQLMYSRFTRKRYCTDLVVCRRRAIRVKKVA